MSAMPRYVKPRDLDGQRTSKQGRTVGIAENKHLVVLRTNETGLPFSIAGCDSRLGLVGLYVVGDCDLITIYFGMVRGSVYEEHISYFYNLTATAIYL